MDKTVERINELYKKSKAVGLSEDEKAEQASLRKKYAQSFKKNLESMLDNTYIVDENGNKVKVRKKQ